MPDPISSTRLILSRPSPASTSFLLAALRGLQVDPGSGAGVLGGYEEMGGPEGKMGGDRQLRLCGAKPTPGVSTDPRAVHLANVVYRRLVADFKRLGEAA